MPVTPASAITQDFSNASAASWSLNTSVSAPLHNSTMNSVEEKIFKALVAETPASMTLPNSSKEDVTDALTNHMSVVSNLSDGNIVTTNEFQENTPYAGVNISYNEALNQTKQNAPVLYTNTVSLGDNTEPLYSGNFKFEYSAADSTYSSNNSSGHKLAYDTSDSDYNIQLAMNSKYSMTNLNPTNGVNGEFSNTFNSTTAFLTPKIIARQNNNCLVDSGNSLGSNYIGTAAGVPGTNLWSKLATTVVSSVDFPSNVPQFGSTKLVQDELIINVLSDTNVDAASTLSKLNNNTNLSTTAQSLQTTCPDLSFTQQQFIDLFSESNLPRIGNEYSFELNIKQNATDGYSLDILQNSLKIPSYDFSNSVTAYNDSTMFSIDDSSISENARLLNALKNDSLLNTNSHSLEVTNGSLSLNASQSNNLNFSKFIVLDGVETLGVNTLDVDDLTAPGSIVVHNTDNTLSSGVCRYTRYTSSERTSDTFTANRLAKLNVCYSNAEVEYLSDVGSISNSLTDNYYVCSDIYTLTNSTKSLDNASCWSPTTIEKNAARANDTAMVFRGTDNSSLFNSNNIAEYEAQGLSNFVDNNHFALLKLTKTMNFADSDESPLFSTVDNSSVEGVTSNISVGNINLNNLISDDMRVVFKAKKAADIAQPNTIGWAWLTGQESDGKLVDANTESNDGYIISKKTVVGNSLGANIYDVLKLDPSQRVPVKFNIITNPGEVQNRDVLYTHGKLEINIPDKDSYTVDVNNFEEEIRFFDVSEDTSPGLVQDLTGLDVPDYYEVYKYITTRTFKAAIRNSVGCYNNLWMMTDTITEKTIWYKLINKNKNSLPMPDSYLTRILYNSKQKFTVSRYFVDKSGMNVSNLFTIVEFRPKDFMGLTAKVQYKLENGDWQDFTDNSLDSSIDAMYDKNTNLSISAPSVNICNVEVSLDTAIGVGLGLSSHISPVNNSDKNMYIINLSLGRGVNSMDAEGYIYDNITDAQYIGRATAWSPYSDANYFLTSTDGALQGTKMTGLTTLVELIDPTPLNPVNQDKVNKLKVTIKKDSITLLSFISDKYILENFNVLLNRCVLLQHEYTVSKTSYSNIGAVASGTEYLAAKYSSPMKHYAKLKFGSLEADGVYIEVDAADSSAETRTASAFFSLNSDIVNITPLKNGINAFNMYSGRYSNTQGDRIGVSLTGYPLATNSLVHRNVVPTQFRGFINDCPEISIIRSKSSVRFLIKSLNGTIKYFDNLNNLNTNLPADIWANRSTYNAADVKLNIAKVMSNNGFEFGSLNVNVTPLYSMYPSSIVTPYLIPIRLKASDYTMSVANPLDTSMETNISSNLFDFILKSFNDFKLVATRIKVYNDEIYNFKMSVPDLKVLSSLNYVGNPTTFTDWTLMNTYSDKNLRDGVIMGDGLLKGVIKIKRTEIFVSNFTKYAIHPRPQFSLTSYNVADLTGPLPSNYSTKGYSTVTRYADIYIDNSDGTQGALPSTQNHTPFSKNFDVNVPNKYNSLSSTVGINNIKVGLNISKYLDLYEQIMSNFNFDMTTNKVKIFNGIGSTLTVGNNYTEIFNDYISELGTSTKWHSELQNNVSTTFTGNKWNINAAQLLDPIKAFLILSPTGLTDQTIFISGLTSYGMGTYTLDFRPLNSVKSRLYIVDRLYNDTDYTQTLKFIRYTSAEGLTLGDVNPFTKSTIYKPLYVTKDTFSMSISIPNTLSDIPFNVDDLIKAQVANFSLSPTSVWINEPNWTSAKSPVSIVTLSKLGAGALCEMLQTSAQHKFKVLSGTRPNLLNIKRSDGSKAYVISFDGVLKTPAVVTKKVQLQKLTNFTDDTFDKLTTPYNDSTITGTNEF